MLFTSAPSTLASVAPRIQKSVVMLTGRNLFFLPNTEGVQSLVTTGTPVATSIIVARVGGFWSRSRVQSPTRGPASSYNCCKKNLTPEARGHIRVDSPIQLRSELYCRHTLKCLQVSFVESTRTAFSLYIIVNITQGEGFDADHPGIQDSHIAEFPAQVVSSTYSIPLESALRMGVLPI